MTLAEVLGSVYAQVLVEDRPVVEIAGRSVPVSRTRAQGLRVVGFVYEGHTIEGIEQNPNTASRWAKLAQEGKRIIQFRVGGKYIANVCEGTLTRYPGWKARQLPE